MCFQTRTALQLTKWFVFYSFFRETQFLVEYVYCQTSRQKTCFEAYATSLNYVQHVVKLA